MDKGMRLVTAAGAGAKASCYVAAELYRSPMFATPQRYGDRLNLRVGLQGVGMVRLYADAIGAAVWVCAEGSGLYGENGIFLPAVSAKGVSHVA